MDGFWSSRGVLPHLQVGVGGFVTRRVPVLAFRVQVVPDGQLDLDIGPKEAGEIQVCGIPRR